MKKFGLINLICSLIVVVSLAVAVPTTIVIGKAIAEERKNGEASLEPTELVIASADATATYDGTALVNGAYEIVEGSLKDGHKIYVTVSGSQTGVGISENYVSAVIKDENGADVTDTYNIKYEPGVLNVRPRTVIVSAESKWKLYDGTPLVAEECVLETPLLKGDYVVAQIDGEITSPGNVESVITDISIYDKNGFDVTHNYNIRTNTGTLVVSEADSIVIQTFKTEKQYDGYPLTGDEWKLVSGELLDGHELKVDLISSITEVGTVANDFNVSIVDAEGRDVTYTYKIDKIVGKLTVNPRVVKTIRSASDSKKYDGTPLTNPGFTVEFKEPMLNDSIVFDVNVTGSITDVGATENTIDTNVTVYDAHGNDITDFFVIGNGVFMFGILEVFPEDIQQIDLKFRAASEQKIYDGTPLVNGEWELVDGALLSGHVAEVTVYGSQTNVGNSTNEIADVVIRSENGGIVTSRYNILVEGGTLSVVPLNVKITSEDAEKLFDGTPLTCHDFTTELGYNVIPDGLDPEVLDNFVFDVTITGTITNPGMVRNAIATPCSVTDIYGEDIDIDNFEITYVEGTLTVLSDPDDSKPELKYKSDSSRKAYDGAPLFNTYYRRSGHLLDGHREEIEMNASITDVGTAENTISVRILDGEDNDVTDQYTIILEHGTLTVYKREITVTAHSKEKTYDATPLTQPLYGNSNDLVTGHQVIATTAGSQTEVGRSINSIASAAIVDGEGNDVTHNYEIKTENGLLTVNKRRFTIKVKDKAKDYDGTPLLADEYTLTPATDALVAGHDLNVTLEGSQTEVGVSAGRVVGYTITDSADNDVSSNYQVEVEGGTLTVNGAAPTPGPSVGPNGIVIGGTSTSNNVIFKVTNKANDIVYLKMASYGDYVGQGWEAAPIHDDKLSNGESDFFVTAHILAANGFTASKIIIEPQTDIYVLPYYIRGSSVTSGCNTDAVISGTVNNGYIGSSSGISYFAWDWNKNQNLYIPTQYELSELNYRQYAYDNYLDLDPQTLTYLLEFIDAKGLTASDPEGVARAIRNVAKYNINYDQSLNEEPDIVEAFLTGRYEGICQHFASAATLVYRALGIPARYSVGFAAPTNANVRTDVTARMAHAWVEIYIDGVGWVNMEVTGTGSPAMGQDSFNITVTPQDTEGLYVAGQALDAVQQVSVSGMPDGYTYEFFVSGTNNGLGKVTSTVTSFSIKDNFGNTVYDLETGLGSSTFHVTYTRGTIHRYLSVLEFSSEHVDVVKEYDGAAVAFTATLISGSIGDYDYEITPNVIINAGSVAAQFSVTILKNGEAMDVDGNPYNDHFKVSKRSGHITINKKVIELQAASQTKEYDGTALVCRELEDIAAGVLVAGDYIDTNLLVIQGSQTNIGSSSNVIRTVVIKNASGQNVTANYQIIMKDGLLTVTRPTA